ncbi:hypothetical protein CVT26_005179 [Gymnopilus dilepis]|uniref:Uncharacterized protein n=1 Tax=Gymnopilus dilepis TaxID=231916 RepID=A0A409X2U7_9AGAR|nr:hypothetical protein CVT26_005179 [Gymnopilus dilepis]
MSVHLAAVKLSSPASYPLQLQPRSLHSPPTLACLLAGKPSKSVAYGDMQLIDSGGHALKGMEVGICRCMAEVYGMIGDEAAMLRVDDGLELRYMSLEVNGRVEREYWQGSPKRRRSS